MSSSSDPLEAALEEESARWQAATHKELADDLAAPTSSQTANNEELSHPHTSYEEDGSRPKFVSKIYDYNFTYAFGERLKRKQMGPRPKPPGFHKETYFQKEMREEAQKRFQERAQEGPLAGNGVTRKGETSPMKGVRKWPWGKREDY